MFAYDLISTCIATTVCVAGSLLSMRLLARLRRSAGVRKFMLLLTCALMTSATIWTFHLLVAVTGDFRTYLSADQALELTYTALPVLAFTALGFFLTTTTALGPLVEIGGALFGFGIALSHFFMLRIVSGASPNVWSSTLCFATFAVASFYGATAANRIARPITRFCKYGGTLAMILAILSTHYVGFGVANQALAPTVAQPWTLFMTAAALIAFLLLMATAGSAYVIDLSAAREASENEKRTQSDPLTGLPTRRELAARLDALLSRNHDDTARVAVLVVDLDGFKGINDLHGHAAGDAILRAVGERLTTDLSPLEFVARVGGDEFVLFKCDVFARGEAERFATRIRELITLPIRWENIDLNVGCSIGISLFPEHGRTRELLLSRADLSMYAAKRSGRNRIQTYNSSIDGSSHSLNKLASDLKSAIHENRLELYYRVEKDVLTDNVASHQAHLRWNHPEKGTFLTTEIVEIAIKANLLMEVSRWHLANACADAASWTAPLIVSVHIPHLILKTPQCLSLLSQALSDSGLSAGRLELDINESNFSDDRQHAQQTVHALKSLGIRIALSEFGSGSCSLSTLTRSPFDRIKLARAFVQEAATKPSSLTILSTLLFFGEQHRIPVISEGLDPMDQIPGTINDGNTMPWAQAGSSAKTLASSIADLDPFDRRKHRLPTTLRLIEGATLAPN